MNLQTSTLAERVSDFFENSLDYVKYATASAAGAAIIALSSGAVAQTPTPAASALAPAAASSAAPAPRRYLGAELQQKVDTFKEICNNPTYMGWLTRYAVRCESVNEEHLRLRLETPVGKPDKQESRQWELYKFGDVVDNFDFLINPETKRIMAQAVADVHNNVVRARNRNAPTSDLLDPALIDIVSAGANGGRGGSRFEVIYDINRHKELYRTVGASVRSRVKQRYGYNTPVWNHQETLVLDVKLLQDIDVQAIRAKIDREQSRQASLLAMYGVPGTVVFEKVNPATGAVDSVIEAKDHVFELAPGVYVARGKDARNFAPFVDVNGDGKTDIDSAFDFSSGWNGTIHVRNQYTGTERISPEVRRSIENEQVYIVRVAAAQTATGTESTVGTRIIPVGTTPLVPLPTLPSPAPETPPTGTAPPLPPPTFSPSVPGTPPTPQTLLQQIDAEAAGMFARLGPHFNLVLIPGYGSLSLEQQFKESGYEARSNAQGPSIAGRVGGIIGEGNGLGWQFDIDYAKISNGNGTVEKAGNNVGAFTYDGSRTVMAAEVAYVRLLSDQRSESEQSASRRNVYLGLRAERAAADVSGTNIMANEQTTDALLLMLGLDYAHAALDGVDHAVSARLGAGINSQSNTRGIDYDAGFSARIAAEYLARFKEMGLIAGTDLAYNTMSTGARGQEQERNELSLAAHGDVAYLWGEQRQHQVGVGVAYRITQAKNSAGGTAQVSEERGDTRLQIIADFAF